MNYPTSFLPADFRWKDDATLEYIGFGVANAIRIPMYKEPLRPTGHVVSAPHEGKAEEAYMKAGGQAGLLTAAAQFAAKHPTGSN